MTGLLFVLILAVSFICAYGDTVNGPKCALEPLKKSTEYCKKSSYKISCQHSNLQRVPTKYPKLPNASSVCLLDLSFNNITKLSKQSFKHASSNLNPSLLHELVLDNNKMTTIAASAFEGLNNLHSLSLKSNCFDERMLFGKGIFTFTPTLQSLNLKRNYFTTLMTLDNELSGLANLIKLYINPRGETLVFGSKFRKLTKLSTLSLSGKSKTDCNITNVTNATFINLPYITSLSISYCHVKKIEGGSLKPLRRIASLDISYNEELKFQGMNTALAGLRNSTTLKKLNVNRLHIVTEYGVMVHLKDLENLRTLRNLETIHMDINKIEVFDERIFDINDTGTYSIPPKLKKVSLTGNRLTYGKYVDNLFQVTGVEHVDLSRQYIHYDPFFMRNHNGQSFSETLDEIFSNAGIPTPERLTKTSTISSMDTTELPKVNCTCKWRRHELFLFCLPADVNRLTWRQSNINLDIGPFLVCGATNLKYVDVSLNMINHWQGPVFGLHNVQTLDLSDNFCLNVTSTFFIAFASLECLNISGNLFQRSFDPKLYQTANQLFANLDKLRSLDISRSRLYTLPATIFEYLPNLQKLILADNELTEWTANLNKCQRLTFLDVSDNVLDRLPESLTDHLDSIVAKGNDMTLRMANNPVECSCASLPFLRWMFHTHVNVTLRQTEYCKVNGERHPLNTRRDYLDIVKKLDDMCRDRTWVTWSIGTGCIIVGMTMSLLLCMTVYKNRWKLRYLYYRRYRRFKHVGYERMFSSDAVISYSQKKASFIKNTLVPVLEGQHGLNVWVADRNSQPGVSLADNIAHAIYTSRKTVLMIDSDYLNESWCDYEMNMAIVESVESKRKLVIFVLMESFHKDKIPINVLRFLKNEQSLEYPDNEQDLATFWRNLTDEIQKE